MATGQIITTAGKKILLNRTFKSTPDYTAPSLIKIGIGTTTPVIGDTDLSNPIPIIDFEVTDDCETADWTDSADMTTSLNSSTYKIGSNALNLTKDGTASDSASTSKTTTSVDFDDKRLEFFLYIADAATLAQLATTDCITIRFGSDSSNYYQWTKDKADLSVGWNYINNLTDDNEDSTTGTPDNNNMDYSFIQITATGSSETWTAGKIIMDDWRVASSGDFTKSFITGYPSLDETNIQSTIRAIILSTEANGHNLSEFGIFNSDTSAKMWSRTVFTAVSKTNSMEVTFVSKDKVN